MTEESSSKTSVKTKSLLNPENVLAFFEAYEKGRYSYLMSRFSLTSSKQVDALYNYLTTQVPDFMQQDCEYNAVSYGYLFQKALLQSYT